jgi:hypothetical protein
MRRLTAGFGLLLACAACQGSDRPSPAELARPSGRQPNAYGIPEKPDVCDEFCGATFLHEVRDPPNLYFLLDRSGSMDAKMDTGRTKYDSARKVIGTLLQVIGHRVRYGASIFPADTDDCGPGVEVFPPTLGNLPSCTGELDPVLIDFLGMFGAFNPGGSTPTSAALAAVAPALEKLDGNTYLVLVTDGAPNCNFDAVCDADECSLNIEGAKIGGRSCSTDFNCCDADSVGPNGPGYCVDGDGSVGEVSALFEHGIPTYVVGMPGAEPYAAVLNRLAEAGGRPREGSVAYYAVEDESELQDALDDIGTGLAVRCSIDLDTPPDDPDKVNVYFDGELVPADPDDGWSWNGTTRIEVNGDACDRLKSGNVIDARAVFGCDTVVR